MHQRTISEGPKARRDCAFGKNCVLTADDHFRQHITNIAGLGSTQRIRIQCPGGRVDRSQQAEAFGPGARVVTTDFQCLDRFGSKCKLLTDQIILDSTGGCRAGEQKAERQGCNREAEAKDFLKQSPHQECPGSRMHSSKLSI